MNLTNSNLLNKYICAFKIESGHYAKKCRCEKWKSNINVRSVQNGARGVQNGARSVQNGARSMQNRARCMQKRVKIMLKNAGVKMSELKSLKDLNEEFRKDNIPQRLSWEERLRLEAVKWLKAGGDE